MFKLYFLLTNMLLNIILILLFVLIGGILPLLERKFLSLTQRRVGPKYVGYKGRLQFIADSLKLLLKNYNYLINTNNYLFYFLPILCFTVNLYFLLNITWLGNISLINIEYNIVFFLILNIISHLIMFITGLVTKNNYTVIASNRILNITFITELFITTFMLIIILINSSFSFANIYILTQNYHLLPLLVLIIPVFFVFFLLDNSKAPFDLVEAETEIIMGYHVEYSGFLFGAFVLVEYLHTFFFCYLFFLIFNIF